MYDYSFQEFNSAIATSVLVGREGSLRELITLIEAPTSKPVIVSITGEGGIGKTKLLIESLRRARQLPRLRVATDLVDLYHAPSHNRYGITQELYRVLTTGPQGFSKYQEEQRKLERMRFSGESTDVATQRSKTIDAFTDELLAIASQERVLLAFDTTERAIYDMDETASTPLQMAESLIWLFAESLKWKNCVILMAGRPESASLISALEKDENFEVHRLELGPLSVDESMEYFAAVADTAEQMRDHNLARRIRSLDSETRLRAHQFSDGRPILLALFIDYLNYATAGQLPAALTQNPISPLSPEDLTAIRVQLESELISRLEMTPGIGDAIVVLGRTPRGADAELVASLLEKTPAQAESYLESIRNLSFVKVRPADRRVFLHDVMYDMLRVQIYARPGDVEAGERANLAIQSYYKSAQKANNARINELFEPIESQAGGRLNVTALRDAFDERRTLITEVVYYRLHQDPRAGIKRYYRYMRESVLSGDITTGVQLHTELLAYSGDATKHRELDEADLQVIRALLALRVVELTWASQNYDLVIDKVEDVRGRKAGILAAAGVFANSTLNVWEANARINRGRPGDARRALELLNETVSQLIAARDADAADDDVRSWLVEATLAFAYRVRGYTQRMSGFMQKAIDDYQTAAPILRQINLRTEMAIVSNDMGFAQAEMGHWSDGRTLVKDALQLRRDLGPRSPVGLSMNTLATIDIMEGNYQAAAAKAEKALLIFRSLEDQRGAGLALTALSEALRRHSGKDVVLTDDERVNLLREARDHAEAAMHIFRERQERPRLVSALTELGCAYRDWARMRAERPSPRDPLEPLISYSQAALEEAAASAGGQMLHNQVDALVDLAWLGFGVNRPDLMNHAIARFDALIPDEYLVDPATGEPGIDRNNAQVLLWPQIGKLYVLKGHAAYGGGDLSATAVNYFWGLQYSAIYAEEYHNFVRAKEEIFQRLKGFTRTQLQLVRAVVEELEDKNHLAKKGSAMRQFLQRHALWQEASTHSSGRH